VGKKRGGHSSFPYAGGGGGDGSALFKPKRQRKGRAVIYNLIRVERRRSIDLFLHVREEKKEKKKKKQRVCFTS